MSTPAAPRSTLQPALVWEREQDQDQDQEPRAPKRRRAHRPSSMSTDDSDDGPLPQAPLDASIDARALVRLVQCPECSLPFRGPVILPCGNTLCRQCLPTPQPRQHISYPATETRQMGITCPFRSCGAIHSLEDCSASVVFSKVMDSVQAIVARFQSEASPGATTVEEILRTLSLSEPTQEKYSPTQNTREQGRSSQWPWGKLLATFAATQAGELGYTSDAAYYDDSQDPADMEAQDVELLNSLKEACHRELDCHVCYNMMLDPTTTPCGHTFCRKCLARILDHSSLCPVCRRTLFLPSTLDRHSSNKALNRLLLALCPEKVAARREAVVEDERHASAGLETPLFVCTMSFPTMPTYLHIFEPRYRLMIRRAVEVNGQFGMVTYNETGASQANIGESQFCEVGTMLQIERYQMLPDGRSFVQCRGIHRFKVQAHGVLDGYVVGRVEKLEDISLADEEALEARETSQPAPSEVPADGQPDLAGEVDRLPTSELMRICMDFVAENRAANPPWLRGRILEAYGEPPEDAATFPYWFASVLPLQDREKYRLLPLTSTRERLKVAVMWIRTIQSQRWYQGSTCTVL
ncbi:hypothetical protein FH972_021751 [Carpinus fangiana]|uniref:RING-type domain-containing protein n=1 Tax=Carpinus fangiana TaxID=176857 RepID=A0A5N6KQK9_9ROSI|nr:hypothetical protein FH972_021751 [Carpinus fangiana]